MVDAVARLWPADCAAWPLPFATRGLNSHVVPFPDYPTGPPGTGVDHLGPRVVCLDDEYAIVSCNQELGGTIPGTYRAQMIAWVVRRSGLDLTKGPVTIVAPNDGFVFNDFRTDMEFVDSTHALMMYPGDPAGGSIYVAHRFVLLERDGMNVNVVDTVTFDPILNPSGGQGDHWFDASRVPGTTRIACVAGLQVYGIEAGGGALTVTTEVPAVPGFDNMIASVDADGRFVIWNYEESSGDATLSAGRLNSDLSFDWGESETWDEDYIHRNASGSTDPVLGSFRNGSACIFYRADRLLDASGLDCGPDPLSFARDQARVHRVDVAADLTITQWAPVILNGQTASNNIAPFRACEMSPGAIAVTYDTVQPWNGNADLDDGLWDEVMASAVVRTSDAAPGGLVSPVQVNDSIINGQFFWSASIGWFGGKYFLLCQRGGGGAVAPTGFTEDTFNFTTETEIDPAVPSGARNYDFHDGTGVFVVEMGQPGVWVGIRFSGGPVV